MISRKYKSSFSIDCQPDLRARADENWPGTVVPDHFIWVRMNRGNFNRFSVPKSCKSSVRRLTAAAGIKAASIRGESLVENLRDHRFRYKAMIIVPVKPFCARDTRIPVLGFQLRLLSVLNQFYT